MTHRPLFSVIIPTYNRAGFIDTAVRSVLNQAFPDFEVIVVDDGSTDNTGEVVRSIRDSRVRYHRKENGERAAARNFGVQESRGEYVNFLDSDDFIHAHHLSTAHEFISKNASCSVFHLAYDVRDKMGKVLKSKIKIADVNRQIISGNVLSCNGVMIKRDVMLENKFNEDRALSSLEDWELWIRLASRYKIEHIDKTTSTIVQHDDRSVMGVDQQRIKSKVDRFIKYVAADPTNQSIHGDTLSNTYSSVLMYAALHLAMARGPRREILSYVKKGVAMNVRALFTKRFLVVMKLLVLFPDSQKK